MGVAGGRLAEVLVFELGGRSYGLPAPQVQELLRMVAVAPLPQATARVEGVINLRGRVVPVLDLRAALGLSAKGVEPDDHLIVARLGDRPVALRVDRALELARPGAGELEEVEEPGSEGRGVIGIVKRPEGLVPVLDLRMLLGLAVGGGATVREGGGA